MGESVAGPEPRPRLHRLRPRLLSQGATFAEAVRMVVKSGGNWKRPVNRMYTYNFHWRELLPPDDQLPGGQEQPRCERGPSRAPLLLREDLPPPAQWDERGS